MDSDPHGSGSICGKSTVAESAPSGSVIGYFMKPLPPSKVVKVMLIIGYTHVRVLVFLNHHKYGLIWFHYSVVVARKGYIACCFRVF